MTSEAQRLGLDAPDAEEAPIVAAAARAFAPLIARFLELDLSAVPVEPGAPFAEAPAA